jgi:hypothetical protein
MLRASLSLLSSSALTCINYSLIIVQFDAVQTDTLKALLKGK